MPSSSPSSSSWRFWWTAVCCWLGLCCGAEEEKKTVVRASIQTGMGAVPLFVAMKEGYFDHFGIEIETVWYPSGAPQVRDAVEHEAWDIGYAGVVPNIIGGGQQILGVAIANDQSAINQLVATGPGWALWPPDSFVNLTVAVTANSTADYVVRACLVESGYDLSDVHWIHASQSVILEALTAGAVAMTTTTTNQDRANDTVATTKSTTTTTTPPALFGGLWAPNTYKFFEQDLHSNATTICHGGTVYKTVTGGIMARQAFAEEHPDRLVHVLAGWMRALAMMKDPAHRETVLDYMDEFFNRVHGQEGLSRQALENDLDLVGKFDLLEQLSLMEREGDPAQSVYDFWTLRISDFMLNNGIVREYPAPVDYITDEYLRIIYDDPALRAFAMNDLDGMNAASAATRPFWYGCVTVVACVAAVLGAW